MNRSKGPRFPPSSPNPSTTPPPSPLAAARAEVKPPPPLPPRERGDDGFVSCGVLREDERFVFFLLNPTVGGPSVKDLKISKFSLSTPRPRCAAVVVVVGVRKSSFSSLLSFSSRSSGVNNVCRVPPMSLIRSSSDLCS